MPTVEFRKSFIETINKLNQEMMILLSNKNDEFSNINKNLHAFIHKRIDSLLILIQHDCLWDADIILRPIAEASVKINFISCGNEIERNKKVTEFWTDLAEINKLKRSNQTKDLLQTTDLKNEYLSALILSEEEENRLKSKWTKSERQKIEQPWSYNEMIKTIAKQTQKNEILCLARNFTQSSHLIHADETALGVIHDRIKRDEIDKEYQMNLHEIRLFSDCLSLYIWNLETLLKVYNEKPTVEIDSIFKNFIVENKKIKNQIK